MPSFQINDTVYAPVERVCRGTSTPHAIIKGVVKSIPSGSRSLDIDFPYGIGTKRVASSVVHKDVGVLIVRIGDFASEQSLLDPLTSSVEQFCRLLIPDDQLKAVRLRTWDELKWIIGQYHTAYTHWILIGHGGSGTLLFGNNNPVQVVDLRTELEAQSVQARFILSLCCHTGEAAFAKNLSQSQSCKSLVAPKGAIHGASACQFAQSFLGYHFLEGKTTTVAFKKARTQTPGGAVFRHWQVGDFIGAA